MILGVKSRISGKPALRSTQPLISKLDDASTSTAKHKPVTALARTETALDKSAAGQDPVGQSQAAEQIKDAINGNMVQGLTPPT